MGLVWPMRKKAGSQDNEVLWRVDNVKMHSVLS